ncbi:MAG: aminotransferase class V-fold PLP-dependent enzyme [Deltaproteobacteria bacterium]|nr:aminotransferase class V-fold PLP-dependent enzyme [Deltaproteobacteria bacterium]
MTVGAVYERWQEAMMHFEDDAFGLLYQELEGFRARLCGLIAGAAGSVWVDQNGSALLSRIAMGLPRHGRRRVVVTDLDFPTAAMVLGSLPDVELEVVESTSGHVAPERIADAIDEDTWLVYVSHATTVTGALLTDVPALTRLAREKGVVFGLDVYQSVGCLPVDLDGLGADFAIGGGHKWMLGGWDLGYAWLSDRTREVLRPIGTGWFAGGNPFTFAPQTTLAKDARCLAAGAPNPLPCMLSAVGLDELEAYGLGAVREHSLTLTDRLIERSRWPAIGARDHASRAGTICLEVPDAPAVRAELLRRGVVVSVRSLPDDSVGLRVAPHIYNDADDIDRLLAALEEVT